MTFISEEELSAHLNDGRYVAQKASEHIRCLETELERTKAAADASSITAEQTCSILEQKFLSLSTEFENLEARYGHLQLSYDHRVAEVADVQAQKHQLSLLSIEKDGEIERLMTELSEVNKSKRQLMELIGLKDSEIAEKNASLNSYLDKIVSITEQGTRREARLSELEVELSRAQALCFRLTQEKELVEKHNTWINDELSTKISSFLELRKNHVELQEEMSSKTSDYEKKLADCSKLLKWNEGKVKELESKLSLLQEELSSSKEASASTEERLSAELSTVNKLVELYKENSEEWSRKSGELEGVVKALELHASQVESDNKGKLETETSLRKKLEKDILDLKEKLDRAEAEVEKRRKEDELHLSPGANFATERWIDAYGLEKNVDNDGTIVPKIPTGVSGTALAASLLRDGWSLAKMYSKYQEAVDALRHEQLGRKESEAVLQRVLCELEEKAGIILDERAEYERMVESYTVMNKNLQRSIEEKSNLEKINQELKVDLRRSERDCNLAQKDISDLQKQITILVKECRDLQLHCGGVDTDQYLGDTDTAFEVTVDSDVESVISTHLLTFRDINGLVGQNAQLRRLVRDLSEQIEHKEKQFEEQLEAALQKQAKEAETKVEAVISRSEEQGRMIESLHTSVAMYKRLYEEEHNLQNSCSHHPHNSPVSHSGRKDLLVYLEDSQEANKKVQEKSAERLRLLEEDLAKARSDLIFMRAEREKSDLEAKFAREKLESFMKEYDFQRSEMNGISTRNIELSHLLVEYQKKLRECSDSLNLSEENSRKYNMELTILKQEKEMLSNSEKRACDEVRSLSERVYRLQASLDTIQSAEEIREDARVAEKKKQGEYVKLLEREWAEAKKELQQERDNLRALTFQRELTLKNSGTQFEELTKELAKALTATTAAESRASMAEAKLSDLERKLTSKNKISDVVDGDGNSSYSSTEVITDLLLAKKEIEKLKDEVRANKDHMLQYKSIAQVNEGALKQMEAAHHTYKIEAERLKESLETELKSLRNRIIELEDELISKVNEVSVATTRREEALASVYSEVASLKDEISTKILQYTLLESESCALKEDLENERAKRCTAQGNYERQVILQSETIQELTRTSELLASMQQEASELRKLVHALKSENSDLKTKWNGEKEFLETSVRNAENKYKELNEQNKILHDRLEALHIQLAERHRLSAAISSDGTGADTHENGSLQNVINYLRRSKEIGETEISLLKQEKLRLQSQLETALKTVEKTQSLLHAERESSKAILFTEDEIKSMQLQIREINLLRESNTQLREENKHNFEEYQKVRELYQKTQAEMLKLETLVREKDIEIEAGKKTLELELIKKEDVEKKLSELIERSRIVDVEEYDQMKNELQDLKEKMKEKDEKMQEMHEAELKLQETVSRLDKDISKLKSDVDDSLQTETRLRADIERQKKLLFNWKKKWDNLSKEKDDLTEEKQSLLKQIEELKQGNRRTAGAVSGDLGSKDKEEKDHRIQILEKTVERQREELRKREERASFPTRQPNLDLVKDLGLTRSKVEQQKLALEGLLHNTPDATLPEDIPRFCLSVLDDFTSYFSSFENPVVTSEPVVADTSGPTPASSQAPPTIPSSKSADDTNQNATGVKIQVEPRRPARRLVRPKLVTPEDSQPDVDPSIIQPNDSDSVPNQIHRKRLAPSTPDPVEPSESTIEATTPALKKPKGSDVSPVDTEKAGLSPDHPLEIVVEPTEVPKDDTILEKDIDVPATELKEFEMDMQAEVPNENEAVDTEDNLKSHSMVENQLDSDKEEGELFDGPENEEVIPDASEPLDDAAELTSPTRLDEEPAKEDDVSMSDAPIEVSPLVTSAVDVAANAEVGATRQAPESEEAKQVSPVGSGSRVVNLAERAKERAMLRQFGSGALPPSGSGGRARGPRGRVVRGPRGGARGARGQSSGSQGYQ